MLSVERINVFYGQIHALRDVSLKVEKGRIVSIVGANGAGKSTLLMTLAGLMKPKSGAVSYDGKPLPNMPHQVLAGGVCLVPERRRLYANLTVRENLMMGAYLRKDRAGISEDMEK